MIRRATESDIDHVLMLAKRFSDASGFTSQFGFDEDGVREYYLNLLKINESVILVDSDFRGYFVGVIGPIITNPNKKQLIEMCWWVNPEDRKTNLGRELYNEALNICRMSGVKYFTAGHLTTYEEEKMEKIYTKMGFQALEKIYIMEVK